MITKGRVRVKGLLCQFFQELEVKDSSHANKYCQSSGLSFPRTQKVRRHGPWIVEKEAIKENWVGCTSDAAAVGYVKCFACGADGV